MKIQEAPLIKRCEKSRVAPALSLLIALCLADPVWGGNGLNMIGYGTESVTMGGADVAVARDTSALNTNPAGLIQIPGGQVELNSTAAFALDVRHTDALGNDEQVANNPVGGAELGYAQPMISQPIVFGIGLFAQGGAGYEYRDLATPFGTRDDFSSLFRIAKLDMGAALKINPSLSIGASLALFYADLNQKIFPNTSFYNSAALQQSFYGYELDGTQAVEFGYKLGAMWKASDRLTLGVAYTGKTSLDMDGGRYISDLTAAGVGKVTYRDVHVSGLNLPQDLAIGAAVQANPALLVSVEAKWIDWSSALTTSTLTVANPDNPSAPAVQSLTSTMNWRDQVVLALGIAYQATDKLIFRAGYNYGRNPIPASNLNPLLAAIAQHTVTAGAGYHPAAKWQIDGGVEYSPKETVRYTNPSLPFGPNAQETNEVLAIHFRLAYLI